MPWYRWLVRDYRANRKVQRMGYVARGLYRELLDEQWLEGTLPEDVGVLADICGCPVRVMEKAWPEIAPCFRVIDGRLINDKLESLRTEQDAVRVKRIEAGRLGGIAKQKVANARHMPEAAQHLPISRAEEEQSRGRAEQYSAAMVPIAAFDVVISIPLCDGSEYQVTRIEIDEWAQLFPAVDVAQELRNYKAWTISKPRKRKTRRGIKASVTSWLIGKQDKFRPSEVTSGTLYPANSTAIGKRQRSDDAVDQALARRGIASDCDADEASESVLSLTGVNS